MKTNPQNYKLCLGSDPEIFVFDTKKGELCSAVEILKKDKHDPITIAGKKGYTYYYDNVAVEGTIPPAESKAEFLSNFQTLFQGIATSLGSRYRLQPQASHIFDQKYLQSEGAQRFGCDPSFNSWEMAMNEAPSAENKQLRSTGVHIHIGRTDFLKFEDGQDGIPLIDQYDKPAFVNLLEAFVGLPLCAINHDATDIERRNLYGKSGEFRPTRYGVEYRVPGPFYSRSPEMVGLVYDLIQHANLLSQQGKRDEILGRFESGEITRIINSCDRPGALELLGTLRSDMPTELMTKIRQLHESKVVPDFYKEWSIGV